MKIAISGIGGVGGYFGGLLAKQFHNSKEIEIHFIARGDNEKAIREKGLQLNTSKGDFVVHPKLVTSDPKKIGPVDLLICCTKSYDLVQNLQQCQPCIHSETIILPLLNGVDSSKVIAEMYPSNHVYEGCVYLISRVEGPGMVKEYGKVQKLYFGSVAPGDKMENEILEIFLSAGIDATLSPNIEQVIWEKFIFISAIATLTSYLNDHIGNILADSKKAQWLRNLVEEITSVAEGKKIMLPVDIIEKTMAKMLALPFETTSSMHRDFEKGGRTELKSLTGYVIDEAKKMNIQVPTFDMMYKSLKTRNTPTGL